MSIPRSFTNGVQFSKLQQGTGATLHLEDEDYLSGLPDHRITPPRTHTQLHTDFQIRKLQ